MQAAVLKTEAEKRAYNEAMQHILQTEVRKTAREIYVGLLIPYLAGPECELSGIKTYAALAAKCAPYLHQALGHITVDDEAVWGKAKGPEPEQDSK